MQSVLYASQKINMRQGRKIIRSKGLEHRAVKTEGVEADHDIRLTQQGEELRKRILRIAAAALGQAVIGNQNTDTHF